MPRVLLVDDSQTLLTMAMRYMGAIDPTCEVITSTSPQHSLSLLETSNFDVLVVDYHMPEMTGLELLQVLRQRGNPIPFILLTSSELEKIVDAARELGMRYYLKKEGPPEQLYRKLIHRIQSIFRPNHPQRDLLSLKARS